MLIPPLKKISYRISYRIHSEKNSSRFNCLLKTEEDCSSNRNGKIGKNGEGMTVAGCEAPEGTKRRRDYK